MSEPKTRHMNVKLYSPPGGGGIHLYSMSLAEGLVASGCVVGFTDTRRRRQMDGAALELARKDLDSVAAPRRVPVVLRKARSLALHLRNTAAILAASASGRTDVLHFVWAPTLFPAWVMSRASRRVPVVLTVHDTLPHDSAGVKVVDTWGRAYRSATLLVCHTRETIEALRGLYGEDLAQRCVLIPLAVGYPWWPARPHVSRAEARARLGLPQGCPIALAFGLPRPYKNVDLLVRAWSKVLASHPDARLLVAGQVYSGVTTASWQGTEDLIDQMGIRDSVILRLDWIPDDLVPLYMMSADLAVLPYKQITGSAVAATAAYWSVPLLLSDVPGFRSAWDASNVSFVPLDADSWALAIRASLEDLQTARSKAEALGDRVRRELSWARTAELHVAAYNQASALWRAGLTDADSDGS